MPSKVIAYLLDGNRTVCADCFPGTEHKWYWSLVDTPRSEVYAIDLSCDTCNKEI